VEYDLSQVFFIATANVLHTVPPALQDRMEVIRLSGYTQEEKSHIARQHLIPKQMQENGITPANVRFTDAGLSKIISGYTREAGLRNLEREIGSICRKVAVRVASGRTAPVIVNPGRVERFLGPEKHLAEELLKQDRVGVSTGLAWTATGGDLLFIEVVAVPGKGQLLLTGQLGEVMKESAQAALSYARAYAGMHNVPEDYFAKHDLHVHVPAGSIPKDGPSAGITIATAIVSVLTGRPVDRGVAMTGEITLRGDVMPIGGLKEKILAAKLGGIRRVILPRLNERDLAEVPATITRSMDLRFVGHVDEVLAVALLQAPRAKPTTPLPPTPVRKRGRPLANA
jgi:ATP-dependent Lon protease